MRAVPSCLGYEGEVFYMKRMERTEKVIGENTFYIVPFAAFTATNISAELSAVLSPMLGSMGAMIGNIDAEAAMRAVSQPSFNAGNEAEEDRGVTASDIMNMDMEKVLPALASAFGSLSGDRLERLMRRLLVDHQNISVEGEITDGRVVTLDKDLADEVFCGDIQDMFILCYEVIKVNFSGFFKKLGVQFGRQLRAMAKEKEKSSDTESST